MLNAFEWFLLFLGSICFLGLVIVLCGAVVAMNDQRRFKKERLEREARFQKIIRNLYDAE